MASNRYAPITMRYTSGSWHQPYGRDVESAAEAVGFEQGDGQVTGDIEGTVHRPNYGRARVVPPVPARA